MSNYVKAKMLTENRELSLKIDFGEGRETVYKDITRNREALELFVKRINSGSVSPLHIEDMIEDFLP